MHWAIPRDFISRQDKRTILKGQTCYWSIQRLKRWSPAELWRASPRDRASAEL